MKQHIYQNVLYKSANVGLLPLVGNNVELMTTPSMNRIGSPSGTNSISERFPFWSNLKKNV